MISGILFAGGASALSASSNMVSMPVGRKVENVTVTSKLVTSLSSTPAFGSAYDCSKFNELILELVGNGLGAGTLTGIVATVQVYSALAGVWYNLPTLSGGFVNPTAGITTSATGTFVIASFVIPAPLGTLCVLGFLVLRQRRRPEKLRQH